MRNRRKKVEQEAARAEDIRRKTLETFGENYETKFD